MSPTTAAFAPSGPLVAPAPATTWWDYFLQHRDLDMPPQVQPWTCSICATDWTLRATGLDPNSTREKVAGEIGYPGCVDEASGLKDTQCVVRVLSSYGPEARQEWVSFDRAYELCASTAGVLNGLGYYHFIAIRGVEGDQLWIANSASGYRGIYETISRDQFDNWGLGPWQSVWLVR